MLGPDFRVTRQRGMVLDLPAPFGPRPVLATAHPSAVLRTEPGPPQDEAFHGLVADLRTAAAAARG